MKLAFCASAKITDRPIRLGAVAVVVVVAELLGLILPLALAWFAIRAIARDLAGSAEKSYLDVLLAAPVSRRQLVATSFLGTAIELIAIMLSAGKRVAAVAVPALLGAAVGILLRTVVHGVVF